MLSVFVCEANIRQFNAQLLEPRPELEMATLRALLLEEQAKLLVLNRDPSSGLHFVRS